MYSTCTTILCTVEGQMTFYLYLLIFIVCVNMLQCNIYTPIQKIEVSFFSLKKLILSNNS